MKQLGYLIERHGAELGWRPVACYGNIRELTLDLLYGDRTFFRVTPVVLKEGIARLLRYQSDKAYAKYVRLNAAAWDAEADARRAAREG